MFKSSKKDLYLKMSLLLILFLCSTQVYASKAFFNDGVRFIQHLLQGQWHGYDNGMRFSSLIYHFMTKIISLPFTGDLRISVISFFYKFFYSFHPMISLGLSYIILKQRQKLDYIFIQIASYFVINLLMMNNQGSFVVEAPSYLWPLCFLIILPNDKPISYVLLTFLFFQLSTSYLTSFFALTPVWGYLILKHNKFHKFHIFYVSLLFILSGILFYYKSLIFVDARTSDRLLAEYLYLFENKNILSIILPSLSFIFIFVSYFFYRKRSYFYFSIVALLSCCVLSCYMIYSSQAPAIIIQSAWQTRNLIVPLLFILLAFFLYLVETKRTIPWKEYTILLMMCLVPNLVFDLYSSYYFKKGIDNFSEDLKNAKSGCHFIPQNEFNRRYRHYGLVPEFSHNLSLALNQKYKINSIFFSPFYYPGNNEVSFPLNSCNSKLKKGYPFIMDNQFIYISLKQDHYPFHDISLLDQSETRMLTVQKSNSKYLDHEFIGFDFDYNYAELLITEFVPQGVFHFFNNQDIVFNLSLNGEIIKTIKMNSNKVYLKDMATGKYKIFLDGINKDNENLVTMSHLLIEY